MYQNKRERRSVMGRKLFILDFSLNKPSPLPVSVPVPSLALLWPQIAGSSIKASIQELLDLGIRTETRDVTQSTKKKTLIGIYGLINIEILLYLSYAKRGKIFSSISSVLANADKKIKIQYSSHSSYFFPIFETRILVKVALSPNKTPIPSETLIYTLSALSTNRFTRKVSISENNYISNVNAFGKKRNLPFRFRFSIPPRQPNEDLDETVSLTIGLRTVLKAFSLSTVLGRNTTSVATTIVTISGEKNATLVATTSIPLEPCLMSQTVTGPIYYPFLYSNGRTITTSRFMITSIMKKKNTTISIVGSRGSMEQQQRQRVLCFKRITAILSEPSKPPMAATISLDTLRAPVISEGPDRFRIVPVMLSDGRAMLSDGPYGDRPRPEIATQKQSHRAIKKCRYHHDNGDGSIPRTITRPTITIALPGTIFGMSDNDDILRSNAIIGTIQNQDTDINDSSILTEFRVFRIYDRLINHIGRDTDFVWDLEGVITHQGPLNKFDPNYEYSRRNIIVLWKIGERTDKSLSTVNLGANNWGDDGDRRIVCSSVDGSIDNIDNNSDGSRDGSLVIISIDGLRERTFKIPDPDCDFCDDHLKRHEQQLLLWELDGIITYQDLFHQKDTYWDSGYSVTVRWSNGETIDEPLFIVVLNVSVAYAIYAKTKTLLNLSGWERFGTIAGQQERFYTDVNRVKLSGCHSEPEFEYGIENLQNRDGIDRIDRTSRNVVWRDALKTKMDCMDICKVFEGVGGGAAVPEEYRNIRVHFVYDVKHNGGHHTGLVTGGHLTDIPVGNVYSGVVSLRGFRLFMFLTELNSLEVWNIDILFACVETYAEGKVCIAVGPKVGPLESHRLFIDGVLCRLRSSGAGWYNKFVICMRTERFFFCEAEPDIWIRPAEGHCECTAVCVDSFIFALNELQKFIDTLRDGHSFGLGDTGSVDYYFGASFARDPDDTLCVSPRRYTVERLVPLYITMFGEKPKTRAKSPIEESDHPGTDTSNLLSIEEIQQYQSLIGSLRWNLGTIVSGCVGLHYYDRSENSTDILSVFTDESIKNTSNDEEWKNKESGKHDKYSWYLMVRADVSTRIHRDGKLRETGN